MFYLLFTESVSSEHASKVHGWVSIVYNVFSETYSSKMQDKQNYYKDCLPEYQFGQNLWLMHTDHDTWIHGV